MATYETEEEQVEAMKKWLKENGIQIVLGIILGIGIIVGWRWWQTYTIQESEYASSLYEKVLFSIETNNIDNAKSITKKLLSDHSSSPYAILSVLNLARQDVETGNIESSHARLQWIIEQNSDLKMLTHIASLRKAQLFLSQEKLADAKQIVDKGMKNSKFEKMYLELQADIAVAQDDASLARVAYTKALENEDIAPQHKKWIQMKLDNLGSADAIQVNQSEFGNITTAETQMISLPISELSTSSGIQEIILEKQSEFGNITTVKTESLNISELATPSTIQEIILEKQSEFGNITTVKTESLNISELATPSTIQEIILETMPVE
ncbi:MAG: tetratricopeptide repeat protein [Thiomargarita sp.]|nr:tetratricopeptide repeat protein [Thiomargarita sp.]